MSATAQDHLDFEVGGNGEAKVAGITVSVVSEQKHGWRETDAGSRRKGHCLVPGAQQRPRRQSLPRRYSSGDDFAVIVASFGEMTLIVRAQLTFPPRVSITRQAEQIVDYMEDNAKPERPYPKPSQAYRFV